MTATLDYLAAKLVHAEQTLAVASQSGNKVFLVRAANQHKAIAAEIAALHKLAA
jgi:hypothetical protein